jgi:tetratricopeptide (TPR) repeat protein
MADVLQLPGRRDANADVLQLVEQWLRGSGKQWLLVLDNADFEDVLFKPVDTASPSAMKKRTIDFLALPSCGQTVLTTRHKKVALQFVDECDIVTVGPMTKLDAIAVFKNKTGDHHDAMDVEKLVNELGFIPLAITHAAAFMSSRVPPCPIQTYLNKLEETIKSDASLLTANYNELRRDAEAGNSVIITWQMSFEHIRRIRPSAADRLSLMSFYDHRNIPRALIHSRNLPNPDLLSLSSHPPESPDDSLKFESVKPNRPTDALSDTSADVELDDDIATLHDYHLVNIVLADNAIEVHPLVQLAARKWLKSRGEEDQWLHRSILNLRHALPDRTDTLSPRWLVFVPHLELAVKNDPQDKASALLLAELCANVSSTIHGHTDQMWLKRCLVARRRHLGNDHYLTVRTEVQLIHLLHLSGAGHEEEAQVMLNHCSTLAEIHSQSSREWGDLHAVCLREAGMIEVSQGHLTEAETHLRRALHLCRSRHTGHALIPSCIESLKDVLLSQGKHPEAEAICRQALEEFTTHYGSSDEHSVGVAVSLADVLSRQGNLQSALEIYNQVYSARKRIFGVDHPYTLAIAMSISYVLQAQNKLQEAASVLQQAYQLASDRYGRENGFTLPFAQDYARALMMNGQADQGLDMMKACAADSRRTLGSNHKDTIKRDGLVAKWEQEIEEAGAAKRRKREKCVVQ